MVTLVIVATHHDVTARNTLAALIVARRRRLSVPRSRTEFARRHAVCSLYHTCASGILVSRDAQRRPTNASRGRDPLYLLLPMTT